MFTLFLEEIESISKNPRQQTLAVGVEPTCILSSETVYIAFLMLASTALWKYCVTRNINKRRPEIYFQCSHLAKSSRKTFWLKNM